MKSRSCDCPCLREIKIGCTDVLEHYSGRCPVLCVCEVLEPTIPGAYALLLFYKGDTDLHFQAKLNWQKHVLSTSVDFN